MRVQGVVILLAAFGAAEAQASSIETLQPLTGSAPSIVTLGEQAAIDPSIVAATPTDGPTPSIVALADTPAGETPSIIVLGGPTPANATAAAEAPEATERITSPEPMVIRGGDVGTASERPTAPPQQAATQPGVPLLDPNDKGTPAKRKALKRQAERLAREAAAGQNAQPDPSTEPVPLGR